MTARIGIGIVGLGKIAQDQHLPALGESPDFSLLGAASPDSTKNGLPVFTSLEQMIAASPGLEAVVICTPPQVRASLARTAIAAGLHVMLEKPPGRTLSEVLELKSHALNTRVSLFASWHSREAAAVANARQWLEKRQILGVNIVWHEDVRVWHPGQRWLWDAGGLGVFDPGINALSIATSILPGSLRVDACTLIFPSNRQAPIAAEMRLVHAHIAPVTASFDFRHSGTERWDIEVQTDSGPLVLSRGGDDLTIGRIRIAVAHSGEYPALYRRFAELIRKLECDIDLAPFQLVADAFLCGRRVLCEPFEI